MAKRALFDEFHLSVLVPIGLAESRYTQIKRTLNGRRFQARLRSAVNQLFKQYPSLKLAKVAISR